MEDIFPNPSELIACVSINTENSVDARIAVVDMLGREVQLIYNGTLPYGNSKHFISTEILPAGSYLVELRVGEKRMTKKLVVK